MPIPTLPAEIISHVLDLVGDQYDEETFTASYEDLRSCCLVARAFLDPARAALYRTLHIRFEDREFGPDGDPLFLFDSGAINPEYAREEDFIEVSPRGLLQSLFTYPHLASFVRGLQMAWFNENFNAIEAIGLTTTFVGAITRLCPLLAAVDVYNPWYRETAALANALCASGIALRTLKLQGVDHSGCPLSALLENQVSLEHLVLDDTVLVGNPRPTFRLKSLEQRSGSVADFVALTQHSLSTLQHLSLSTLTGTTSLNLSPFLHLSSLILQRSFNHIQRSELRYDFARLAACASLRHLVLIDYATIPLPLPPLPPSLYSLDLSRYDVKAVELLTYLGDPRSSQLRQLKVCKKSESSVEAAEDLRRVCEERGIRLEVVV